MNVNCDNHYSTPDKACHLKCQRPKWVPTDVPAAPFSTQLFSNVLGKALKYDSSASALAIHVGELEEAPDFCLAQSRPFHHIGSESVDKDLFFSISPPSM